VSVNKYNDYYFSVEINSILNLVNTCYHAVQYILHPSLIQTLKQINTFTFHLALLREVNQGYYNELQLNAHVVI
jgi:hypothetical protein